MKKIILSILGVAILGYSSVAQIQTTSQDNRLKCITDQLEAEILQNPAAAAMYAQDDIIRAQEPAQDQPEATVWYIPVVFHLVHHGGIEFISDDQIMDAFDIMNRDWKLENSDADNVHNDFNANNPSAYVTPADVDIEFVLATKAPDGTCFSGITYTYSTAGGSNDALANAVRNGNDVYQGEWAGNKYLNIFISDNIGAPGAAAYTYRPSNWLGYGMEYGIFANHNYVGSIGTSSPSTSRTLTHEAGHWLNLKHTWGDGNSESTGDPANCNDDDGVSDTPLCTGLFTCNLNANSCDQDNAYWGGDDVRDNAENYMDYSYCTKMFTPGQVTRMRNSLNGSVCNRSNLKTNANLAATGADGNLYLCDADFSADKRTVCAGETINFSDDSYNAVTGWTWTFTGGSPASSTSQNPSITYNTPGIYEVVLSATDGNITDDETKTSYVRVLPGPTWIPMLESFETYSTLVNMPQWDIIDWGNNAKFELTTTAGHTGTQSAKLANYGQQAGNFDELASRPVDLSSITSATSMTLSFRYSYRKRGANNDEWLKVYASNDCGDTWNPRKTLHGDILGSVVQSTAWTPSVIDDWTTVHMTNITSAYWTDNFRYKFEFESDGGNNFYLDNINIYAGSPNNGLVVGLEEQIELAQLTLFPNPAENEVNVRFNSNSAQVIDFYVQDLTGKVVQTSTVNAAEGTNLVVLGTEELSSGMYFLKINTGGTQQSIQFVVK